MTGSDNIDYEKWIHDEYARIRAAEENRETKRSTMILSEIKKLKSTLEPVIHNEHHMVVMRLNSILYKYDK